MAELANRLADSGICTVAHSSLSRNWGIFTAVIKLGISVFLWKFSGWALGCGSYFRENSKYKKQRKRHRCVQRDEMTLAESCPVNAAPHQRIMHGENAKAGKYG